MRSHWYKILNIVFAVFLVCGTADFSHAQYPGFDGPGNKVSGSAGLVPVQPNVDGGIIPVGATAQVVVLFRNEGGQPVQTGEIKLYPSSNVSGTVSLNQCAKEALPSGAECAVAISVKGLQAGAWRLEMLMLHNGRTRLVTTTLSGAIEANADATENLSSDVEIIPNDLNFGALGSSHTLVESVILRNITSNAINVENISITASDGSGFSVDSNCASLEPAQVCLATVKWAPQQKGPSTGVMIVKHDGPTALVSVPLSGDYDPDNIDQAKIFPEAVPGRGLLVSSQTEVNFGNAVASASTITVSLVNTGDSVLTIEELKLSGKDNGLTIDPDGCTDDLVLEPIEACPLTLTWTPTRVGDLLDDIQISHDGARGILIIPVRGTADTAVSKDQKAIVLEQPTRIIDSSSSNEQQEEEIQANNAQSQSQEASIPAVANASSALDGLKITSFSASRAIVNGPSGSRLLFDKESAIIGGVLWDIDIRKNGIEFAQGADRVLLLFDRSLSSVNQRASQSTQLDVEVQ